MFKPKYPVPDTYIPTTHAVVPAQQGEAPSLSSTAVPVTRTSAVVELVKSKPLAVVGGVVVTGAVLTSMFLAIAITAGSLALLAVVIRSLMSNQR
ncbi:SpdD protein [Streptomyces sp. NBC_00210]|uniref:SpdD protein n=1 Tax=Streptomyces sp. NBC_00210 TaxID=2903636 RepID=UPI00324A7DB6